MPLSPKSTPQSNRGVPWAPSPLLSRLGFRVVWCCPVLFGHTLNQRTLLGICCPLRNRHCLNNCSFGMGGSLFFSPFPSLVSGQAKIRLRFTHRTRLVFALSEGVSSFFFAFRCRFLSQIAFCLGRLKSACVFCGRRGAPGFFCGLAPRLRGRFWGFGARSAGGSLFSSLSLVSCCCFFFFLVFWCGHTFSNAPSPSGLTEGL